MIDQDTIFLLSADGQLDKIPHRRYESEDLLQKLIDGYPEILVGEQIDPDEPPRWLMVQREAGIPDSEGGYDRWSIDHVLLDQNGRPTLVEVKRSTDTRIRREVVGQMLDYAANAFKYWPKDRIRELAASQYGGLEELESAIRVLLEDQEADLEAFWQTVDRNLRDGDMRLLFVADQIPTELRRIIEFLNENMPRIEVLGVEIRQYERDGTRVLVPRVVGQTESARQSKRGTPSKPKLNQADFLDRTKTQSRKFFLSLFSEIERRDLKLIWGTTGFSVRVRMPTGRMVTLGYGVVPQFYGAKQDDSIFQVFLQHIPNEADPISVHERLLATGWFEVRNQHSLDLNLGATQTMDAAEVLQIMFELGERLSSRDLQEK